jgi:hypothetical protein
MLTGNLGADVPQSGVGFGSWPKTEPNKDG